MLSKEQILNHIFAVEGGYSDHPQDNGGPTNLGITINTLSWYKNAVATIDDVKNISKDIAKDIYEKAYWKKLNLDNIKSAKVQLCLMDQAVNRGPGKAANMAQLVCGYLGKKLTVDGVMGPVTAAAINSINSAVFCREFIQFASLSYVDIVQRNPSQIVFLKGWMNRLHVVQDLTENNEPAVTLNPTMPVSDKPELLDLKPYEIAKKEQGQSEILGSKHNPRIVEYHSATTLKATTDEIAWCSSFVCWCFKTAGNVQSTSAAAVSWLNFGKPIELPDAQEGDVVIKSRPGGNHVTFFVRFSSDKKSFYGLGGNQSNTVNISKFSTSDVKGVRRFS